MWWLFTLFGILAAAYLVLCLFYFLAQERFIFVRFRVSLDHRFKFTFPFTEEDLIAEDGARLHALYFSAPEARGVVLYFHGNTGSLRRWGKRAPRFTGLGYDVLMPDYRGYGKSRGTVSEENLHEDALRWFDRLRERWPAERIVIYGRSLGSAMAVPLAVQRPPGALVLESPFANLIDLALNHLPILPYRWLLRFPFRSDVAAGGLKCPVYIFQGERDNVVPLASALKLYSAIPPDTHREIVLFPKGDHQNLWRYPRFHRKLRAILDMVSGRGLR